MRARTLIKLLRPKQWTKNLLVFAGLLFTASIDDRALAIKALIAFAAMCLASSGTYAINDAVDAERDRNHPEKKNRPVASGEVRASMALIIGLFCIAGGLALAFWLGISSGLVVAAYLVLQVLYNFALKRTPVADVFGISLGFVLRAMLGATAISVSISGWLLFCTGALALLLGFAKRRHEYHTQGEVRAASRESLGGYSDSALDALVLLSAAVASICYGIYSLESPTAKSHPSLFLTTPFVFYGICRYVFLVFSYDEGGEPESVLLRDPHIWGSVAGFILAALAALQGFTIPVLEGIAR